MTRSSLVVLYDSWRWVLALLVPNLLRARQLKALIYHSGCDVGVGKATFRGNIWNAQFAQVDETTSSIISRVLRFKDVAATDSGFAPSS